MQVIIALEGGPINKGVLYAMLAKGPTTVLKRVTDLQEAGIILEEVQTPSRKRYLSLTPKGQRIAAIVGELNTALSAP
jgi:DNA-binding MarR family transcriptional regulator